MRIPTSRQKFHRKKGAAVAEIAICLPIIFVVIFGSIEVCNLTFLKQAITSAAYEGSLAAILPDATEADVLQRVQMVLDARDIDGTSISINGPAGSLEGIQAGELFTVHVEAQAAANLVGPVLFGGFNTVQVDVAAQKQ